MLPFFSKVTLFCLLTLAIPGFTASKIKIKDVSYKKVSKNIGKMVVQFDGQLYENPSFEVRNNILQLEVDQSIVWPKIEKKVTISDHLDTTLMAYQFDGSTTRVRALLPYKVKDNSRDLNVTIKKNLIEVEFPRPKMKIAKKKKKSFFNEPRKIVKKDASKYDETYLNSLLKEKETTLADLEEPVRIKEAKKETKEDKVNLQFAANDPLKEEKDDVSLLSYTGKFVALLLFVLTLFYGIVSIFKKAVVKKGKLGFLNSTQLVSVLSTTYISPKRSILMVRAHDQIFMVGNSENGLQFLSEVTDVNGLIKEGERQVSGSNFDTKLGSANDLKDLEDKIKIKENPLQEEEIKVDVKNVIQDKVKFSDQIKNKMKNLKSLQ